MNKMRQAVSVALAIAVLASWNAIAACGGDPQPSLGTTSEALRSTGAPRDDAGVQPLFFTQFVDPAPGAVSVHAVAFDDRGNTFVLGHNVRDVNFVYRFDAKGAFVSQTLAAAAEFLDESVLRVNETGFVAAGTQSGAAGPTIRIDRFDAHEQRLFQYAGLPGTAAGSVDLCRDATTVVAEATTTGDAHIVALGTSGEAKWTTSLDDVRPSKARCTRDGRVRVVGVSRASAPVAVELDADGSIAWRFSSNDSVETPGFAIDDAGKTYVGATLVTQGADEWVVFALSSRGREEWRFTSNGPNDTFRGVAADGPVAITGMRGPDFLTVELDHRGRVLWTRVDAVGGVPFGQSVSLDVTADAFVCGSVGAGPLATGGTNVFLYGHRGREIFAFQTSLMSGIFGDVTGHIARCVGNSGSGIGILAFRAR